MIVPVGKNDGSVDGERYFDCDPKFGLFVRPDKLNIDRKGRMVRGSMNPPPRRSLHTSTTMGSLATATANTSTSMKRSKSSAEKLSDSAMRGSVNKSKQDA